MPYIERDIADPSVLIVAFSYHPKIIEALKSRVPYHARTWDNSNKVWRVAHQYGREAEECLKIKYPWFDSGLSFPSTNVIIERRFIKVMYMGRTKPREDGTETAFGEVNGDWSYIFPRRVLEGFFTGFSDQQPDKSTYYSILQVKKNCTEDELTKGFRRMAKLWHPDINQEPDAQDMFIAIKQAYDVLKDPGQRAKYDMALMLEAEVFHKPSTAHLAGKGFRSPLTCGMLDVTVEVSLKSIVKSIHRWEDIVNSQGKTLVTSWKAGAQTYTESWV